MGFLDWFLGRRPVPEVEEPPAPKPRPAAVEWRNAAGELIWQDTNLLVDDDGKLIAVVRTPPSGELAHLRETGAAYPVEILSKRAVAEGYELTLDYLWEGRRREERLSSSGPAVVESDGMPPLHAEVVNVSDGGMQLFTDKPLREGSTARIKGNRMERIALVRYCSEASGGYRVGLQFFGEFGSKR